MNKCVEWNGSCQRCRTESDTHIMSMFNMALICLGCWKSEKNHPDYEIARAAEAEALKRGDRNFQGIGYPRELANDPIDW